MPAWSASPPRRKNPERSPAPRALLRTFGIISSRFSLVTSRKAVQLPPAIRMAGQLILRAIFRLLCFLLAIPLTAGFLGLIQKRYVGDVLGDPMDGELEDLPRLGESGG